MCYVNIAEQSWEGAQIVHSCAGEQTPASVGLLPFCNIKFAECIRVYCFVLCSPSRLNPSGSPLTLQ